jgi:hypothetical protein
MKDRYNNQLEIGDTVLIACLRRKSAYLREAVIKDICLYQGREYAKVTTEVGGSTRVGPDRVAKVFVNQSTEKYAQKAA